METSIGNSKSIHLYKILALLIFLTLLGVLCQLARPLWLRQPATSFPLSLKWQADLGYSTYERPILQDGLVLLPADYTIFSSYWYGIEANTGQIAWSQRIGSDNFRRCLTTDYLVVSSPGSLFVLKAQTGEIVWQETEDRYWSANCSETMVFSIIPRGWLQAFDISNGQKLWGGTNPRKSFAKSLIYNSEAGEIIARELYLPGKFYTIDPNSGTLLDSFEAAEGVFPPDDRRFQRGPMYLIDRGQIFIGGTVLGARTGQVIHKEERYRTLIPPVVTVDTVYISSNSGVVALDRETHSVKWIYQPQSKPPSIPLHTISPIAILDGVGYVIFMDATLRAFDLETGQELGYWQPGLRDLWGGPTCDVFPFKLHCLVAMQFRWDTARAGLTTSEDTLFVSFGDGKLYAFDK